MPKAKPKQWRLTNPHFRDIHGSDFIEAICPHGIGHHQGIHGCHDNGNYKSCCTDCPKELWDQVTKEDI